MNHKQMLWLQAELSKQLSQLLEEEISLSVDEAQNLLINLRRSNRWMLRTSTKVN